MPEGSSPVVRDPHVNDSGNLLVDRGTPEYSRRLTDKILTAFNHAYSIGEFDLADKLREVLVSAETRESRSNSRRQAHQAESQADLWVAFVDARNRYRNVKEESGEEKPDAVVAFNEMKEAYRRWSSK